MKILSCGFGVQSSCVAMMACGGEIEKPDAIIFSDTGYEPRVVYEWIEKFMRPHIEKAGIPFHIVSNGNLKQDALVTQVRGTKEIGKRWASLPYFTKKIWTEANIVEAYSIRSELDISSDKYGKNFARWTEIIEIVLETGVYEQKGMIRRQCTNEYKIMPVVKKQRELLGYGPRKRIPAGSCEVWKGISLDEIRRATVSNVKWYYFHYPLIELRMDRNDCKLWFKAKGFPVPPRSSCLCCPYHNDNEWRNIRDSSPKEWDDVVAFDKSIRNMGGTRGQVFLHRQCLPLDEVNLLTAEDFGQMSMFDNECQGMCGL